VLETGEIRPVGSSRTRKVSCRILAATNAEIEKLVAAGRFRQDLLFRLMRMVVRVPPLRERPEDILPLAGHFLNLGRMQLRRAEMAPELGSALRRYSWPGNVRELRNEVERMRLTNSDGLAYDLANLEPGIAGKARGEPAGAAERTGLEPQAVRIAEAAEAARAARVELEAAQAEAEAGLLAGDSLLRRRGRLRELFARHRMLTRKEAARLLAVSGNTATAYLQRLIMEGLIERVMPNSSPRTHYFTLKGMKLAGLVPPEGWTKEGRLDKSGKPPKIINLQWVDKPGTGGAKPPKPKGRSPLQKYLKRLRKQRGGRR